MRVWVVTADSHDGRGGCSTGVMGVFSTLQKAETYISVQNDPVDIIQYDYFSFEIDEEDSIK